MTLKGFVAQIGNNPLRSKKPLVYLLNKSC